MGPPRKRQRLSQKSVPDADLQKRRAQNDNRLKSIFESIFDKYGKNFDGIGDEIDLRTGEIVVNNGHLLGMTNERDAGHVENSLEELESEYSSSEEGNGGRYHDEGDAALFSESETSPRKLYSVEHLMQDAETEPLATTFDRSLHDQIIDHGSDEDELADGAIEWVTPREARAIAHQKWQLPDDGLAISHESIVEEAWRVPSLSKSMAPCSSRQKVAPIVDHVPESMDPEEPGTLLWGSTGRRRRRSRPAKVPPLHILTPHAPVSICPEQRHHDTSHSRDDRKYVPWTEEEEDLLRYLKSETKLSYRQMDNYFPKRPWKAVASKWTQMVNCGKASQPIGAKVRREPRPISPTAPCHAWPTCKNDYEKDEQCLPQRQQGSETDVSCDHPTKTLASELSSLLPSSVDNYLEPQLQNEDTSWLSELNSKVDQSLSGEFPPTISNAQYLIEELQRGFRVQYPSDGHSDEIEEIVHANHNSVPVDLTDYSPGHTETGVYVQGNRYPASPKESQLHHATSPRPRCSHVVEDDAATRRRVCADQIANYADVVASQGLDDAAMRRRVCVDQLAKYAHVVAPQGVEDDVAMRDRVYVDHIATCDHLSDPRDGPLLRAASGGQRTEQEPVLNSVSDVFPVLNTSDSFAPQVTMLLPPHLKEKLPAAPALVQQGKSFSIASSMPTQEVSNTLSSPVDLGTATKPDFVPLATLSCVEHAVRVLIPRPKFHEVCGTSSAISGLAEKTLVLPTIEVAQTQREMVMSVLCGPGGGSNLPGEAPPNSDAVHDVEIPDSQPDFSSPPGVDNMNADPIVADPRSLSKTPLLTHQSSVQPNNQLSTNINILGSEFDDELSVVTLRPKRQVGASATIPINTPRRANAVTPLTRQARKKRDPKIANATVENSLRSLPIEMVDCSEDELSFR